MTMRIILSALLVCGYLSLAATRAQGVTPLEGIWLSQSGETKVRVAPCGQFLCGAIVWVKTPGKDRKNRNAAKRSRDLVGIQMITRIKPGRSANQWAGRLYNYKDGGTYSGRVTLLDQDRIQLSGCILGGLICRSQIWTRAD